MDRPVRTCVGCRERSEKSLLLRLVGRPGTCEVLADPNQTAPGRGAYLHHDPACLELAIRRRALGRALRLTGVDPEQAARALGSVSPDLRPRA
ncbi:YlxR family protein [Auraticoccus monumenti]|uniref:YlxR domain-containing protein n=1 Tax=Auraticoccus monumenti TaxID=675864 RepID=A0A1G7DB13_9ACTN|nr:YlxR family protein [Auraticoccus monumenti]SDE47925.1 hypothetical protein SAMN04489747_3523 [Auraticoccus monumenti]